ncbi:hypothetical protein [Amycolatopsis sp. cmx-4-68]|uniref:hypothetical protein n=1 Tax=Amycolatopsis sp. cmx-4-68 TaxID=2790938 RepID=UPI003978F0E5
MITSTSSPGCANRVLARYISMSVPMWRRASRSAASRSRSTASIARSGGTTT